MNITELVPRLKFFCNFSKSSNETINTIWTIETQTIGIYTNKIKYNRVKTLIFDVFLKILSRSNWKNIISWLLMLRLQSYKEVTDLRSNFFSQVTEKLQEFV